MKILVTGANGFIGKNLIAQLKNVGFTDILAYDKDDAPESLEKYTKECEFVFHLAGINRPKDDHEFKKGNTEFTSFLLNLLKISGKKAPILFSSSIQALSNNPYGKSKKACEDLISSYGYENGVKTYIYRLPNVFGKWSRPNYNSVIATFCYNLAHDLDITINDPEKTLELAYIDDVVDELIAVLTDHENKVKNGLCQVKKTYKVKLGELANKLFSFRESRKTLVMPPLSTDFNRALYSTYLAYLPEIGLSYPLEMKRDDRGLLSEFIKSESMGQIFISKTKPGITRGNHWHQTKVEKFLVIQGEAAISLRKVDGDEIIKYRVSGSELCVVDIPAGYTHSITNIGNSELITLFWANEIFNPDIPDTYYEIV